MANLIEKLHRAAPFDHLQQEALTNLVYTGDRLDNLLSRFFRKRDLTFSQFNLLRILQREARPLTCSEIAQRMIQVVPAVTGLVDRLEQRKYVSRRRSKEDRRIVYVSLTDSGSKLADNIYQEMAPIEIEVLKLLTRKESKELIRLLEKLSDSIACIDV